MPRYRHPRASEDVDGHAPFRIHVSRAEKATVAPDGTFEAPKRVAEAIADRQDVDVDSIRVDPEGEAESESDGEETCHATTASGSPCSNPAGPDGYCHLESHGPD